MRFHGDMQRKRLPFLSFDFASDEFLTESVNTFFRRLAEFGHFVELQVRFNLSFDTDIPDIIVQEFIHVAQANGNL
jgi:hypothetical protein